MTRHQYVLNPFYPVYARCQPLLLLSSLVLPCALPSLALAAPLDTAAATAADEAIEITIVKQGQAVEHQVAFVPFAGDGNFSNTVLQDLQSTELKITSENLIQQPHSSAELSATLPTWQQTGIPYLVIGSSSSRGNTQVNFEVIEVATGIVKSGPQTVTGRDAPEAAHKAAARIYQLITGKAADFNAHIIYVEEKGVGANKTSALVMRDGNGDNPTLLTQVTDASIFSPAVSPDGRYVAYSVQLKNQHAKLYKLNLRSLQVTPLATNLVGDNLSPAFSPNGNQIVFSSTADGDADIYQANSSGGPAQQVLNMPYDQVQPSYNPKDGSLVFASDHANPNRPSIYRYTFSGSPTRLSRSSYAANPSYSADGSKIAYLNGKSAAIMNASGNEFANFGNTGIDEAPSFSPSNERVVYAQGKGKGRLVIRSISGGKTISKAVNGTARSPVWVPSTD